MTMTPNAMVMAPSAPMFGVSTRNKLHRPSSPTSSRTRRLKIWTYRPVDSRVENQPQRVVVDDRLVLNARADLITSQDRSYLCESFLSSDVADLLSFALEMEACSFCAPTPEMSLTLSSTP